MPRYSHPYPVPHGTGSQMVRDLRWNFPFLIECKGKGSVTLSVTGILGM
jgi:hypothetical protein